jgi:hypothetical protein
MAPARCRSATAFARTLTFRPNRIGVPDPRRPDPKPPQRSEDQPMIHPPDPELRPVSAVRDGRLAPVTCAECGCRLQAVGHPGSEAWFHFQPLAGRDARGCRVGCVDMAHDIAGQGALVLA